MGLSGACASQSLAATVSGVVSSRRYQRRGSIVERSLASHESHVSVSHRRIRACSFLRALQSRPRTYISQWRSVRARERVSNSRLASPPGSRDDPDDSPSTPDANVTPVVDARREPRDTNFLRFQCREATRAARTRRGFGLSRVPPRSRTIASVSLKRPAHGNVRSLLRASNVPGYVRRACARRDGSAIGGTTSGRKSGSGGGAARGSRRALVRWYRVVPRPVYQRQRWSLQGETSGEPRLRSSDSTGKDTRAPRARGESATIGFSLCVRRGWRDTTRRIAADLLISRRLSRRARLDSRNGDIAPTVIHLDLFPLAGERCPFDFAET